MIVRLIVQTFIWFGAMGIPLFLAAGTFAWPGAWDYLVLMVALSFTLGNRPGPLLDTASDEDRGRHIAKRIAFNQPQRLAEDAILIADEAPDQRQPAE